MLDHNLTKVRKTPFHASAVVSLLLLVWPLFLSHVAAAGEQPYKKFGDHKVFFSVFNSSFIKPEIARLHNLTRGNSHALVNVAIIKGNTAGGIKADVSGTATNLMQQQRKLVFKAIKEKDKVYYLAPVRFTNEEVLNFAIDVKPEGSQSPYSLTFTRTLYVEK